MKKILFIEDESALQETLKNLLGKEGYEVIPASDGESGLKLAREKRSDLILLDLILPKLDGFEVLKELKKDPVTKEIPVIVLTNLENLEYVEQALKLGATTYLVKTQYSLEEILEKIKKTLTTNQ